MTHALKGSTKRIATLTADDMAQRSERAAPVREVSLPVQSRPAREEWELGERGLLRPGHEVRVGSLSSNSVTVNSPTRLKPGTRTDLQLLGQRRILRGEIDQCRVSRLEPLCYEAVFIFHQSDEMAETQHV